MSKYKYFKTDMVLESAQLLMNNSELGKVEGITIRTEILGSRANVKLTVVDVLSESGAEEIGKPVGKYITVECEALRENDVLTHEEVVGITADILEQLVKLEKDSLVLIVGLGNWNVTPDSLGPKVIAKTLVTRHIMDSLPKELQNTSRSVSAVSPGVMGLTGIETGEIVKGIVDRIHPDLIIAIDALAARSSGRVNTAIQISDTGISPGSGMGNNRMALNLENLGVPVIGIGVPTVVDAATLVNDTMDLILEAMKDELPEGSEFFGMLGNLESEEKYSIIRDVLDPHTENMFVAPKEVDEVMERLSSVIANSLNIALHPGIELKDMNRYTF